MIMAYHKESDSISSVAFFSFSSVENHLVNFKILVEKSVSYSCSKYG